MDEELKKFHREYSRDYYKQHKEEILRKRKEKYERDPEFRKKQIKRTKESKIRNAEKRKAARLEKKMYPLLAEPIKAIVEVAGRTFLVKFRTAGYFAKALGTSVRMIRHWEWLGALPETKYKNVRGHRLYPDFQVKRVARIYWRLKEERGDKKLLIQFTSFEKEVKVFFEEFPLGFDPDYEEEVTGEDYE